MPDEASPAVSSIPEELALTAGRLVARLHFLSLNEGIGGAGSRPRLDCLREFEKTMISLFQSSSGGKPRKLATHFREAGGLFLDEDFREEFLDRIETARCSHDPNLDAIARELAMIVSDQATVLLKSLHKACSRRQSLCAWIRLGVCLEEGLCPPDATSARLKIRWSQEHGPMPAEWKGTFVPGLSRNDFDLFVRAASPGELPIKDLWIYEVTEQLRGIESQVDPASLDDMQGLVESDRVTFLDTFIAQVVQDFRSRAFPKVRAKSQRDDPHWIHVAGEDPPADFLFGPIAGTKTQLGLAFRTSGSEVGCRQDLNHFETVGAGKRPRCWIRRVHKRRLEAFFRNQRDFEDAQRNLELAPTRNRPKRKEAKRNERK